ncbi:unnamed protein product [Closterium sp. NIES-54]
MYRLTKGGDYIILIVYVDDLLYIGSTDNVTTWFEGELQKDLTLTVSSTVTQYLGLNIQEEENAIYLNAARYANTIAKRFSLTPTTISTPYRYTAGNNKEGSAPLKSADIRNYQRKLGCLLFVAVTCRPDLSYSASQLATYLKRPEEEHMAEIGCALNYLVSTATVGLTYHKNGTTVSKIVGYVDADHAGDPDNRRSRTGYIYRLEPIGPISWQSSKAKVSGSSPSVCTSGIPVRGGVRGPLTGPDEPPLPAKPTAQALPEKASDDPRSGLDFLRATNAPVTPEPPRSTAHDSAARVTPTPSDSPHPVAFTLPPAVASCSKDPPPPSPSPTPSTVRVSVGPPSASSTPKQARNGKWAQSTLVVGGRRIPPPDNDKEAEQPEEVDIPVRADTGSPALTKMQLREQVYLEASINYETKWSQHFSWLVFGKTKDGFPYVKWSICMSYAKGNTRYAMQGDNGGRDLQTQSFRAHEHTDAHKAAVNRQLKLAAGIREGQQAIFDFINSNVEGRRAIRLMRSTQFLCQCDAPISMFPKLMRHLAEQDTPDIPRQSYSVYLTRYLILPLDCSWTYVTEALAVKDAVESNEDLGMVDKVVCTVATLLENSSVWSQRFKYLQRVIYQTNLEVQGIHTVRWLSRGDAVRRLCKVLGACIVLLWEHNHKAYEIVTCYKFQFCLIFLADILADMNDLNRCFQRRESTTGDLTERYLTTNKPFGGEGKSWLVNFLKVHKEGGGKQVRVRGVDGEGRPINHLYTMHERKLKGHKQGSTYADCVKMCHQFARNCVDNLNERLDDLGKLGPTKLFRAGKWSKIKAQREKKCKEWLHGCSRLFRHKLPGFDLKAAERELPTFCAIMESHHEMESFAQGLHNFLGSVDSKR